MSIKRVLTILLYLCMAVVSTTARAESYVTYYHNDLLGSPVAATDEGGNLLWRESYKPYGEKIINDDSDNTVGYTGHQFDKATELVYMQARYYDPVIGRFMGVDPLGFVESNPMSFNRYAYANNNPYHYVDPDGNIPVETVWDIANVGMGVVSFSANVAVGNYWGATLDAVGVVADGVATIVPYVPGGAGTAIKGYRATQKLKAATKGGKSGDFSIVDWKGYPDGVPKPTGPVRLVEGAEYDAVRKAANKANNQIRKTNNLRGQSVDVHEVTPVKFGGSPTDPANKVILDRDLHRQQVTPWWNKLQKDVGG